jgi:hypothetical protein
MTVFCSNSIPTDSTTFGHGVWIRAAGAQSNWVHFHDVEVGFCSRDWQFDQGIDLEIEGGNSGASWVTLFQHGGQLVTYKNSRDENSNSPIVIDGGTDLTLDHLSFSNVTGGPVVSYSGPTIGTFLIARNNTFEDASIPTIVGPGIANSSATLYSDHNRYPSGHCPDFTLFAESKTSMDLHCNSNDGLVTLNSLYEGISGQPWYLSTPNAGGGNFGIPSPTIVLQGSFTNPNDDATYIRHQPEFNSSRSYLAFSHPGLLSTLSVALPPIAGGVTSSPLTTTPVIDTVLNQGTPGGTTYTYKIVANDSTGGHTPASAAVSTATGNATLSSTNFNVLNWRERTGAYNYTIYRTVGGATQGVIGTVWPSANTVTGYFFNDQSGAGGDGTTPPTTNTTGNSTFKRLDVNQATTLVTGDFTLGAGWGATASTAITLATSKDQASVTTITTAGAGIAANPTYQITFHDGTWTQVPTCSANQTGGNDILANLTVTARSATAYTFQWNGTPTTGKTYEITILCTGT